MSWQFFANLNQHFRTKQNVTYCSFLSLKVFTNFDQPNPMVVLKHGGMLETIVIILNYRCDPSKYIEVIIINKL